MAVREQGSLTLSLLAKDLASGKLSQFMGRMDQAAKKGGLFGNVVQGIGISFGMMLNPITLGITAIGKVTDVIGGAVSAASELQMGLATVNTVAGLTESELKDLRSEVQDLSVQAGKSTGELTDAMYDLVSAGVDAGDVMEVLEDATTLAEGALSSTNEAVDLMTSSLNAWGMEASDSTRVMDVWAKTVALGKTNASQLSSSIAQIAPIASATGVSIEEVAAAYATMTAQGTPAAQAATQMRAAVTALLKPNRQLKLLQDSLNGSTFETILAEEGLAVALQAVSDAAGGNTEKITKALGSAEAYNAVLQITGKQAGKFTKNLKAMRDAADDGGVAVGMAAERMDTLEFAGRQLDAMVKTISQDVGELLLPFFTQLAKGLVAVLQGAKDVVAGIGDIGDAIQDALDPGRSLREELESLGDTMDDASRKRFQGYVRSLQVSEGVTEDLKNQLTQLMFTEAQQTAVMLKLADVADKAEVPLNVVQERFEQIAAGMVLSNFAMQDGEEQTRQLTNAWDELNDHFDLSTDTVEETTEAVKEQSSAAAEARGIYADWLKTDEKFTQQLAKERIAAISASKAQRAQAVAARTAGDAAADTETSVRSLVDAFLELGGSVRTSATKSLKDLRAELKRSERAWKRLGGDGDQNKKAIRELSKAIEEWERKYLRAVKNNDSARAALAAETLKDLRKEKQDRVGVAKETKRQRDKLVDLKDAAEDVPDKVNPKVTTPGAQSAISRLERLQGLAASLDGSDIDLNVNYQNNSQGQTRRGQFGMHLPAGRTGFVGEAGPELVRFRTGAQIVPFDRANLAERRRMGGSGVSLAVYYQPRYSSATRAEAQRFMDDLGPDIVRWLRRQ